MDDILTIQLVKQGEDLSRRAFLTRYGERIGLGVQPLAEIGSGYQIGRRRGVCAIDHVLETADPKQLAQRLSGSALVDAGHALFEAAFGLDEPRWQKCFTRLFGATVRSPAAREVRLRIVTDVPLLRRLPWAFMAYNGDFLRDSGWTFAIGADVELAGDEKLELPTGILLIMPELARADDNTASASHRDAIREIVDGHMPERHPDQLRVVQTREEVRRALVEARPAIVYYYGHGDLAPDGEPRLRVPARSPARGEDPESWNLNDIARAFPEKGTKPLLIYLNGCLTGRGPWQSVASKLAKVAPVVLAHATVAWADSSREVASRFFRRLFSAEMDPVEAAMMRDPGEPTTAEGWVPLLAFERYRSFEVRYVKPPPEGMVKPLDFDRHRQRQIASAEIRELAQKPERRVQAFVVVAPQKNHAEEVATQLHSYTDRHDRRSELTLAKPRNVSKGMFELEAGGAGALERMAERFKLNLGRECRVDMRDVLQDAAPARVSCRTRVLWLDWGVLPRAPTEVEVRDWLAFGSGRLTEACPDDLRIVATLAIEVGEREVDSTRAGVAKLVAERRYRSREFRASMLDPLGRVDAGEIADFLEEARCPSNLQDDLASWMHEATGGEYASLRELIAWAFART